jgi:adenylate cyclase
MGKSLLRHYRLANELTLLFDLESSMDNILVVAMCKLNQIMDSERSSVFLFDPLRQQFTSFSSQDFKNKKISMSQSSGVAGWVFKNRIPAIINNAYIDSRVYQGADEMTGFRTRNLICTPLIDYKENCLGTLQAFDKKSGNFTADDLELLDLTARLVVVSINNSRTDATAKYKPQIRRMSMKMRHCGKEI